MGLPWPIDQIRQLWAKFPVSVQDGGTGATTPADARANLGIADTSYLVSQHNTSPTAHAELFASVDSLRAIYLVGAHDFNTAVEPGVWEFGPNAHLNGPTAYEGTNISGGILRVTVSRRGELPYSRVFQEYLVWNETAQQSLSFTRGYNAETLVWGPWVSNASNFSTTIILTTSQTWVATFDGLLFVQVIGGGGGAGSTNHANYPGGAGGGGGYAFGVISIETGMIYTVTIGAGGALGGTYMGGSGGGASSFGSSLVASGGGGGGGGGTGVSGYVNRGGGGGGAGIGGGGGTSGANYTSGVGGAGGGQGAGGGGALNTNGSAGLAASGGYTGNGGGGISVMRTSTNYGGGGNYSAGVQGCIILSY